MRLKSLLSALLLSCVSIAMMATQTVKTGGTLSSGNNNSGDNVDWNITSILGNLTSTKRANLNSKTSVFIITSMKPSEEIGRAHV